MHDELRAKAVGQRRDVRKTKQLRGTIYDRNGRALAISVRVKTLFADATKLEDIDGSAKKIAKALDIDEKKLRKQLREAASLERKFVPIAKGLDDVQAAEINSKLETAGVKKSDAPRFPGLHWRDDQMRSYPNGDLAAHVIGFSNAEGVGQAGIEQSQNEGLYGAVIKKVQERDRLGRVYDEVVAEQEAPNDLVLTIDGAIQYKAEEALATAVKNSNAKAGMAIVINNKTGEVLAMANYPTFDPNKLGTITADNLTNRSVQSMYSPGSVFKLITYGSALEKGLITPDATLNTGNGTVQVANRTFRDSRALGQTDFIKAMAVSSNVGAIKTAMRVGKEDFHKAILNFGFGERTGIELPAETAGVVRPTDRWFGDSLASMAIGYEIGVSALQMATAFATIANDGVRIQPHIIKEIRESDETPVSTARPEKNRVVSAETARSLRTMLREVVISGTGKQAQVNGYEVAGKTGTAWKFDEKLKRVNAAKYISSFIGFAPANDPEVTIAIVIDEPKTGGRGGGAVAAPVFREIAEQILPDMGIRPGQTLPVDQLYAGPVPLDEIPESVGNGELVAEGESEKPEALMPDPAERVRKVAAAVMLPATKPTDDKATSKNSKERKTPPNEVTRKRIETANRN